MNIYSPVVDGVVDSTVRVRQGQSYKNISFGLNATPEEYADAGLYLIIANKPEITDYERMDISGYTVDEEAKTITVLWTVSDLPPDVIASMLREEEYNAEQVDLKGITLVEAEDWVRARLQATTLDTTTKVELGKIFKKLIAFSIK